MSKIKVLYLVPILLVVILISSFTIVNCNSSSAPNPPIEYDKFEKEWEKADSLISVGLPKSALELVENIYEKAKGQNNSPQFIKASLYKLKLKADFEEAFIETTVADLKAEIAIAKAPTKQILHSILADVYWRYYQANRYKFLERTTTTNPDLSDIQSWDLKTMQNAIIENYLFSLEDKDLLLKANLRDYDIILETAKESKKYRPTLYDFLAFRAVDFFMNDESSITQPVYRFEIDKENYFAGSKDFVKIKLETKDSLSLKFYTLKILQDLVKFHLNDENPTALIDANLKRLTFVYQNATFEAKDKLYLDNLVAFEKEHNSSPASADISYKIAYHYFLEGNKYNPLVSEAHKWDKKNAVEKCQQVINKFPESDGAKNCTALLAQINEKTLQLTIDYASLPNKPFLGLLSIKNTPNVYFKIAKVNYKKARDFENNYRNQKEAVKKYISLSPLKTWDLVLPNDEDYQSHSTETNFPALEKGFYVVLVSTSDKFNPNEDYIAYQTFWISNISYLSQNSNKGHYRFYTLHREKGDPIKSAKAQLFYRNYNYNSRTTELIDGRTFMSDNNGYFEVPALKKNQRSNSFYIEFTSNGDTLVTTDQFYHSYYSEADQKTRTKTWFFTDRAIYRPGQTVYFKGIVLDKTGDKHEIKPNHTTTVKLFDVNYQQVSELKLTTNEYGSVQGSFTAPSGGLNGRMTIKNESGSVSLTVEEYKRPKFEVVYKPIEGSYKLNEIVTVTGNAQAFAGNNISMANVKYRVVRETQYPWWFGYFRNWFPTQSSMEIKNGITQTNENGDFVIDFSAIPDQNANWKYKPVFNYTIYADVTDVNGETQSNTTHVRVSSVVMEISLDVNEIEQIEDFKSLTISTKNLNGQKLNASGRITISKLHEPERLIRERNWGKPDLFTITKETFINDFPFDNYKNENDFTSLKVETEIASFDFNTKIDSVISLSGISGFVPGRYLISATSKDGFGEDVEYKKFVTLFSEFSKKIPVKQFDWFYSEKEKYEPGQTAKFIVGSADKNVHVMYEIVQKDNILKREWIKLSNEQKIIGFPIMEGHRGGLTLNVQFVKQNRAYTQNARIAVPFTNKELEVEFSTFRDKLTPGQQETWALKIKGKNGDKVAAELLASMYDISLDKFIENNWDMNLYPLNFGFLQWNSRSAFSTIYSKNSIPERKSYSIKTKEYDRLNWFGFNYYGNFYYRGGLENVMLMEQSAMPGEMAGLKDKNISADANIEDEVLNDELVISEQDEPSGLQIRRDFKETAFFYPTMYTNEDGDVGIKFTVPESLTKWKLMGLAHTKDLKYGFFEKEVITRKDLMIVPNTPRFFRKGDKMKFSAKVVNMSDKNLSGIASLRFIDTRTNQDITKFLLREIEGNTFDVKEGLSQNIVWEITIPDEFDVISYQIIAKSGNFSDGEEKAIPVLSNRMLVTESLPMPVKGNETKKFKLKKLITSGHASQETQGSFLKNHKLSLEFSSNPSWYAVQALPYLFEQSHESADAAFRRYYANSIASYIVNSNPKIKQVFDTWKNYSPDALLSNLEKNQELKSLILNETPWVRDAQNETERKQRVAVLFDLNNIADNKSSALRKLYQMQSPNGGFPWYKGGRDNLYITQRIVTGFGHLNKLSIINPTKDNDIKQMVIKAVRYLDQQLVEDYKKLQERETIMDDLQIGSYQVQYLYARSYFFEDISLTKSVQEAFDYYYGQAIKYWTGFGIYQKGMIALSMERFGKESIQHDIMKSIDEYSLTSEEMGKYWRDNKGGYYWYEAPIETQALLIEAYDEVSKDKESVELMKIWLLKQKQTQDWKTPKATADAVYALLLRGSDWLANDKLAIIEIGNEIINPLQLEDTKVEAGTGYFKTSWPGNEVKPSMGNITVTNQNESIAWGAVYWQYFEDLDKITFHKTPLAIDKKLYLKQNTDAGPVLKPIEEGTTIKVGDKVKVRVEIRVDRNMEFVHMKDMRASAFEPVNVLSSYHYQGGLGYYQSTLDASTNFFFDYLPKGTYIFEYELTASQKGDFSNGITTIQCMYAPEYTSHSEGVRVVVE